MLSFQFFKLLLERKKLQKQSNHFRQKIIKLMHRPLTKEEIVEHNRQYFKKLLKQATPRPYPLNTRLTTNPFIRHEDKFQYIVYHLNEYNKRIQKNQVTDKYQMLSYQRLYSMISDLAQIQTKGDQQKALDQVYRWYKEQSRLVQQRKDQGEIRYQMNKSYRKFLTMEKDQKVEDQKFNPNATENSQEIPSEMIARLMQPFYFGNRTSHKQLQIPLRRLNQYKRKVINIAPFIDGKEPVKPSRVLYPMPPKYQPKDEEEQPKEELAEQQPVQQGQTELQIPPIDGQQKKEQLAVAQPQQDLGGFGEEPQQPDQEEPVQDTRDKLAPKNKLYTAAVTALTQKQKPYSGQYMHFRGRQNPSERSLQMRYLKLQQEIIVQQREDKLNIELANQRARNKSKVTKDIQKKLQDMLYKPVYKFSAQEQGYQQKLSQQDEIKFGFTASLRAKPRFSQIDISSQTVSLLPRIHEDSFTQKSIRRQRVQSLKSKFSKLLNLSQYEQRETAPSMCQYTARKRGISDIIRAHSKSRERLDQLDEVTRIKEKLTRNKIGINIKALSQGLCLPDSEENSVQTMDSIWPNKILPSNPFMVETKKKKKKKK